MLASWRVTYGNGTYEKQNECKTVSSLVHVTTNLT